MQGMKLINKYVLTANTLLEMECVQYCKFLIQHLIQKTRLRIPTNIKQDTRVLNGRFYIKRGLKLPPITMSQVL